MRTILLATAAMLLLGGPADTHEFKAGPITVEHPWARPAAKGNGAAYFALDNTGQAGDRLIGVSSDIARSVEMHTSAVDAQGVASMRPVQGVDLPPGGQAQFAPGGLHVMLIGLAKPLVEGDEFPLTLTFEQAGNVSVKVAVEKKASHGAAQAMAHDHTQPSP
jgi:periplasmic copper chaperone A